MFLDIEAVSEMTWFVRIIEGLRVEEEACCSSLEKCIFQNSDNHWSAYFFQMKKLRSTITKDFA